MLKQSPVVAVSYCAVIYHHIKLMRFHFFPSRAQVPRAVKAVEHLFVVRCFYYIMKSNLIKCIEMGNRVGIRAPEREPQMRTNFIR